MISDQSTIKKYLAVGILIVLTGIPAFHKVTNAIPPNWFIEKFSNSFLGSVPAGIELSYVLIIILEIIGPLLLVIGLASKLDKILQTGFLLYYFLFLVLTFGSFLVEDYSNGFKDFTYFVGIFVLDKFLISNNV